MATLINNLSQGGYISVIARPTHVSERYATLIDHIYTNSIENFLSSGIITNPISDHLGTYIRLSYKNTFAHNSNSYNHTDTSRENKDCFAEALYNEIWTDTFQNEQHDPDHMFTSFHNTFGQHYSTHFPVTKKKPNDRKNGWKPWLQPWLKEACERKNTLYHTFVKSRTQQNKTAYLKKENC